MERKTIVYAVISKQNDNYFNNVVKVTLFKTLNNAKEFMKGMVSAMLGEFSYFENGDREGSPFKIHKSDISFSIKDESKGYYQEVKIVQKLLF